MHITFLTAEVVPFAKVGGLADVTGALPPALAEEGVKVSVFVPLYGDLRRAADRFGFVPFPVYARPVSLGPLGNQPLEVYQSRLPGSEVPVFLFHCERFFGREGIYTEPGTGREFDDAPYRYLFFVKAALEFLLHSGLRCDVLHCHDSHTALAPALLNLQYGWNEGLRETGSMLTIHNIAHVYQGKYSPDVLQAVGIPMDHFFPTSPFEYFGTTNFMKTGIHFADIITTVSERYAQEIRDLPEYGCGLEGILQDRSADLHGVLNGVDYSAWSPETDSLIPHQYDANSLGDKRKNKEALLEEFGFEKPEPGRPVVGMVGRLTDQKGLDLVMPIISRLVAREAYLVVLGTGQPEFEQALLHAAEEYPGRVGVRIGFDNALAHLIEAGSDLFLMPSRFEPCGLNQMYSMRYGTIPVVRATGGLADTVEPWNPVSSQGSGFVFEDYEPEALWCALQSGLDLYEDARSWMTLVHSAMARDFSWQKSARRYLELYREIRSRKVSRH